MLNAAEELESAAALCGEISQWQHEDLTSAVLEPVCSFLGADMGVFRAFHVALDRARLATIRTLGVPERVNEAYLTRYFKLDPARQLLRQRLATPMFADELRGGRWLPARSSRAPEMPPAATRRFRQDFAEYRRDFLLPNRLYHHLGFCFQDPARQYTYLFDFHRVSESAPFGRLELSRSKVLAVVLHTKFCQLRPSRPGSAESDSAHQCAVRERLSARELEIAEAVALGLSNKEVAQRMKISIRTVENHLRSIFAKLDVTTRTRLAAKLHEARSRPAVTITTTV